MAGYSKRGVCGKNPVCQPAGEGDPLFSRKPSFTTAPICVISNPKILHLSVFNSYDKGEGVECYVEISQHGKPVVVKKLAKSRARNAAVPMCDGERAAQYNVTIYSPSKYAKKESKDDLGLESGITQTIAVYANTSNPAPFAISRKASILHDFKMAFRVSPNPGAQGKEPLYELAAMSKVAENSAVIQAEAAKQGVDPGLVKAIMYMETTHGWYDAAPAFLDLNKSLLPMNIRSGYWKNIGFTRNELKKVKHNVAAGTWLIKKISERATPYSIENVATLYQDLGATKVTEYGARVKRIYDKRLWIPEPSLLEKINIEFRRFERLSPMEQARTLERLFGGR